MALTPFAGELDAPDSTGLKPFTGTLDGEKPTQNEGILNEIGRGLSYGAKVQTPKMIGQTLQFAGADELGAEMVKNAEARATSANEESKYGKTRSDYNPRGAVYEAATNAVPSLAPGAAGAAIGAGVGTMFGGIGAAPGALIGYGIGSIASLPIFYGSQAQTSYEKIKAAQLAAGAPPDIAESEARIGGHQSGAIEAGGEMAADYLPFAKVLKPFAKPAAKMAGTMVKEMFIPTLKGGAKTLGKVLAGEVGTEMAQQAGEAQVEKWHGAGEGATWADTGSVILPTALMTLIPGMAGGISSHVQINKMRTALESADTAPETRIKLAMGAVKAMEETDPETAKAFSLYTGKQIDAGAPIEIKDDTFYNDYAKTSTQLSPKTPDQSITTGLATGTIQPGALVNAAAVAEQVGTTQTATPEHPTARVDTLMALSERARKVGDESMAKILDKMAMNEPKSGERLDALDRIITNKEAKQITTQGEQHAVPIRPATEMGAYPGGIKGAGRGGEGAGMGQGQPGQGITPEGGAGVGNQAGIIEERKVNAQAAEEVKAGQEQPQAPATAESAATAVAAGTPAPSTGIQKPGEPAAVTITPQAGTIKVLSDGRYAAVGFTPEQIKSADPKAFIDGKGTGIFSAKTNKIQLERALGISKIPEGAILAGGDVPFSKMKQANLVIATTKGMKKTHKIAPIDGGYAIVPKVAAAPEIKVIAEAGIPAAPTIPKNFVNREAVVFQNRDRSTPALISQMQGIAKAPDYTRVAPGYEATSGAPIVEGELPASAVLGKRSIANTANKKLEIQYAVVEADDLIASHSVDGSPVAGYEQGEPGKLRAIGGNARVAGIKEAYRAGSANEYATMLRDDTAHGVPAEAIAGMKNPVLVRIMRSEDVTPNIGIELNARTNAAPQVVDQAKDDARSFKIENIELSEDGTPSSSSLKQFVMAMPDNERAGLMDRGQPNKNAQDRLNAAIFYQAYGNDELVRIYAESTDEEAKAVISALASAAPSMAKLEGADVDVRDVVTDAAKIAINARRQGKSLLTASQQGDIEYAQTTMWLVRYFAENIRAPRRIGEMLTNLANRAYDESAKQGEDIFGEQIPKKNVEQLLQEQGYNEPRTTQGNGNQVRPELIPSPVRREGNVADGQDQAQAGEGAAQPTQDYGDLLSSYSAEELKDRKAQLDAIEKEKEKLEARLIKEEKDRLEHEDIKRRSVAAAKTFTLGGDATTNLSGQSSLFQKAKQYDPNQLIIQLNDHSLRPGEDTEQTRVDRAGLAASVLVRGHRGSLLGLSLATDWITGKGSSLLGKRVTSPADLATLGAVLRDPRAETFRYFLVKEGKVVYHTAVSSRLLGSTRTFIGEPEVFLADLKATMEKLGADSYYLMHNHPARAVEASKEDIRSTEYIANKLPGFLGHVILDHTEFGLIESHPRKYGKGGLSAVDAGAQPISTIGTDPTRTNPIPHAKLDEVVSSPNALASMADAVRQPDNIVLVAVDHQMHVTGIMQVSRESMKKGGISSLKIMARLRKIAGAHEIFAILPDGMKFDELPNHITKNGWLLDVHIAVAGKGVSAVNENMMGYQRGGASRKNKLGMAVDQPSTEYATKQTDTPEFKKWFGDWSDRYAFSSKRTGDPVSVVFDHDAKKPMVVYHATNDDFNTFETGRETSNDTTFGEDKTERHAIFASPEVKFAEEYLRSAGNKNVMPLYMNIKSPIDLREGLNGEDIADIVNNSNGTITRNDLYYIEPKDMWQLFDGEFGKNFVNAAKKSGFDGAMLSELDSNREAHHDVYHDVYAAFDPTQIKSSIGNNGQYSLSNPSIVEQPYANYQSDLFSRMEEAKNEETAIAERKGSPQSDLFADMYREDKSGGEKFQLTTQSESDLSEKAARENDDTMAEREQLTREAALPVSPQKPMTDFVNTMRERMGDVVEPTQEQQATAILDRANVTGKDRLDIMRDFKDGKHTLEDLESAYPAANEAASSGTPEAESKASFEHAGYKIYQTSIKRDGQVKQYWAVQDEDNRQRASKGEREIGGDSLHETKDAAIKEAERQAKFTESNNAFREKAAAAESAKKEVQSKREELDGFDDGLNAMQRGKVIATLTKAVRIDGKESSLRDAVRKLVADGEEPNTKQVNVIQDMTRMQAFRADQRTQDAHAKKQAEAGKKTVYYVGGYDLGKTAHDYAAYLIEQKSAAKPSQDVAENIGRDAAAPQPKEQSSTEYIDGKKYHQKIPEVTNIRVANLKRMDSGEVNNVSDEVANGMDFSEPIHVSVFADGELRVSDGHHRVAAARQRGIKFLPVDLQSINAKGEVINALIRESTAKPTQEQKAEQPSIESKIGGYPVSGLGDKALTAYLKSSNEADRMAAQAEIDRRAKAEQPASAALNQIVKLTREFNQRPKPTKARQAEIIAESETLRKEASRLGATTEQIHAANNAEEQPASGEGAQNEPKFSQSQSKATNPHTISTLTAAIDKAMGQGFAKLLELTGKFKIISSADIPADVSGMFSKSTDQTVYWHGSASGDLRGGRSGLHLGTKEAARQALEARIGIPATGEWDGTREYGKTLLAGKKTQLRLNTLEGRNINTGQNSNAPYEDYYPEQGKQKYADGTVMPMDVKPNILPYTLNTEMTNARHAPLGDTKANASMAGQLKKGTAKRGYYYKNTGEDAGSISVVVPNGDHIEVRFSADGSRILAFVRNGETFLVADNISSTDDNVKGLLTHEIGLHALQLGRNDAEFQAILKQFNMMGKAGNQKVQEAQARVPADTPAHLVEEESLGYYLEAHPDTTLAQKVIAWFKAQVRKIGANIKGSDKLRFFQWANKLTPEDIVSMASQALRSAPQTLAAARDRGTFKAESPFAGKESATGNTGAFGRDTGNILLNKNTNGDPSPSEAQTVEKAIEGGTVLDAARFIVKTGNPAQVEIAKKVLQKLVMMQAKGEKLTLRIIHENDDAPKFMNTARGYAQGGFGETVVWLHGSDMTGRVGTSYEILLHELVHAATAESLRVGKENPNSATGRAAKDLVDVTNAIHAHINNRFRDAEQGKVELTEFEKDINAAANNAFDNDDEVLSWALSNKEAQKYLDGIPYKNTGDSLWTKFVQAIRTMLGLKPSSDTALSEVLRVSEELLIPNVPTQQSPIWRTDGKEMYRQQVSGRWSESTGINSYDKIEKNAGEWGLKAVSGKPNAAVTAANKLLNRDRINEETTKLLYNFQDNFIDLRRMVKRAVGITEEQDASLAQELYSGTVKARTDDFHQEQRDPLVNAMHAMSVKFGMKRDEAYETLHDYLHAKHAPTRNLLMREINPTAEELDAKRADLTETRDLLADDVDVLEYKSVRKQVRVAEADVQDGEADQSLVDELNKDLAKLRKNQNVKDYIEAAEELKSLQNVKPFTGDNTALSGMSNTEAAEIIAKAKQDGKDASLEALSKQVYAIIAKTRQNMLEGGLITPEEKAAWESKYGDTYVPLHRDEVGANGLPPIGQGMNIRGKEAKAATGSTKEVTNILAHVVAQQEASIIRTEKNAVDTAMFKVLKAYPDSEVATLDEADMVSAIDKTTGLVVRRVDPTYKSKVNVLTFKINGEEHTITFNEQNPEAMRMAAAFKNLSAQELGEITKMVGGVTRFLATMNTSANPVFLARNFMRDLQTAFINLSDTELAGKKREVFKNVLPAIRGFWAMSRNGDQSEWGKWAREFRDAGGQTGWLAHYENIGERAEEFKKMLSDMGEGKAKFTMRQARWLWKALQDGNAAVENGVRLASYVAARKSGMSEAKSAQLAKNLTVNFNKHGAKGVELNMWYMFMNASIQGTARLGKAAMNKNVQKILASVVVSGLMMDILARSLAGDDDDDGENDYDQLPEYVKANNWIFWVNGAPVTIPMPYGYNFIASVGRKASEQMFRPNYSAAKGAMDLGGIAMDAFSPLGSAGGSLLQFAMPTIADPFVQIAENKSFSGNPIFREQAPYSVPKPQYQMGFRSASAPAQWLAEMLNEQTGGNEVRPGMFNLNPSVLDFIVSTGLGGFGKTALQTSSLPIKLAGEEPIQGREVPFLNIFTSAKPEYQIESKFYRNLKAVQLTAEELKQYQGKPEELATIMAEHAGEIRMGGRMKFTETMLGNLNKQKRQIEKFNPENRVALDAIDAKRKAIMSQFNKAYVEATAR